MRFRSYGKGRRCVLFTPERISRIRLLILARELNLDLDHVAVAPLIEVQAFERFELFVCMGNEVLPPIAAIGCKNLYHCQFPFPLHIGHFVARCKLFDGYVRVLVNLNFTTQHYEAALNQLSIAPKHLAILPPPVPTHGRKTSHQTPNPIPRTNRILNVGRFAPGGHCNARTR